MTPIILDAVVAVLLLVVIGYAFILNRRLGSLRRQKSELLDLVASFHEATIRAETSVQKLKASASEAADSLKGQIGQAQTLFDDLDYMVKRSNDIANRLETAMEKGRTKAGKAAPAPSNPAATAAPAPRAAEPARRPAAKTARRAAAAAAASRREPASEAERELMKALEQVR